MNFKIFSDFETIAKKKLKSNNALVNITIASFLEKSLDAISNTKNSSIFNIFHTKSSRSNYIASELVLQYLENKRMKITIKCANEETLRKYFRKHSDKWIQRELQLRTRLDLFSILISDRKNKMISTNILKSNKGNCNTQNNNSKSTKQYSKTGPVLNTNPTSNELSSSFITPSPTPSPSPKNQRIDTFTISNNSRDNSHNLQRSNQLPNNLSSSDSQNLNSSPKSKQSKILNITEMSSENQYYFQKKVVDGNDNCKIPNKNHHGKYNQSDYFLQNEIDNRTRFRTSNHSFDFDSEAGSENSQDREKYSVSEASKYRTVSTTDKTKIPRFLQLNRKPINSENKIPTTPNSPKERQVTFVDENQNQILPTPKQSSFSKNNSNPKRVLTSDFSNKNNQKPSSTSLIDESKINKTNEEDKNNNKKNIPNQTQLSNSRNELTQESAINQFGKENNDNSNKHRRSRENRRRVRLSKNMPPKAKPVDDADEYDVEFLREIMNEKTRSGRKEKYELYKEKNKLEANSNTIPFDKDSNNNDNENEDSPFFFQDSICEKDWDKIYYSESCSEIDDSKISNKFVKTKESSNKEKDEIIDDDNSKFSNSTDSKTIKDKNKDDNEKKAKIINLSFDDNCFYFEKEPTDNLPKENAVDVGVEVNFDSFDFQSKNSTNFLEIEEEEEDTNESNPNYYSFSVIIYGAKNVIKTDLITTCDPYCKLIIKDEKNLKEEANNEITLDNSIVSIQTQIENDTQNPEWNEKFTFNLQNIEEKSISFLIYDHDTIGTDKLLNSLTLPLSKFVKSNNEDDEWLKMKSNIQVGTLTDLHLCIKATPEYGSTNDVDFSSVNQTTLEIESENFNPINFDSNNDEESEIENRNDNLIINKIENSNDLLINEEENEFESNTEINMKSEDESEVESKKFDLIMNEEESQTENNNNNNDFEKEEEEENNLLNKFENEENNFDSKSEEESEIFIGNNNDFAFEIEEESQNDSVINDNAENYDNGQDHSEKDNEEDDNVINIDVDIDISKC